MKLLGAGFIEFDEGWVDSGFHRPFPQEFQHKKSGSFRCEPPRDGNIATSRASRSATDSVRCRSRSRRCLRRSLSSPAALRVNVTATMRFHVRRSTTRQNRGNPSRPIQSFSPGSSRSLDPKTLVKGGGDTATSLIVLPQFSIQNTPSPWKAPHFVQGKPVCSRCLRLAPSLLIGTTDGPIVTELASAGPGAPQVRIRRLPPRLLRREPPTDTVRDREKTGTSRL